MIHRADKRQFYTIVDGETIGDPNISLEALGLLVRMLALNDEWKFSIEGLAYTFQTSKKTIARLVRELKDNGYISIVPGRGEGGLFASCEWHVFEKKTNGNTLNGNPVNGNPVNGNAVNGNPVDGNPVDGNPEKGAQTNINITNINKTNIYGTNTKEAHGEFENVLLTSEQFKKLGERLGEQARDGLIEELSCYLQNHPRKYKDHYATVLTWARKKEKEPKPRPRPEPIKENPFTELLRKEGFL